VQAQAYRGLRDEIAVLIMDEASQVPVAEAAIPLSLVHSGQGRIVLAGDSS
jgi:superfamily I DNA and/or RNA helicase